MSSEYPETVVLSSEEHKKAFEELFAQVPDIAKQAQYDELYGYQLDPAGEQYNKPVAQAIVFKYLKANEFKVEDSAKQLKDTLKWRKEFKPLKAGFEEKHDPKYKEIGYLTFNPKSPTNVKVVTWNLYGAKSENVKNPKEYFANYEEFVRWRIGLMEQAIGLIDFTSKDNNYIAQIHDYANVSFLSTDSSVKKVGKEVVALFQAHYPEFLSTKYFLNFPFILAWVYNYIVKNYFISAETVKKFHILHSGKNLAKEFEAVGIPKSYGGDGDDLKSQNVDVSKITISPYASKTLEAAFQEEANDVD